jgi:6-phosphogluconolactonase
MIHIYKTQEETVIQFAKYLISLVNENVKKNKNFNIALSGGNTPQILFKLLKENYSKIIDWNFVHFYWGDERCVLPDSEDSNYGHAFKLFLNSNEIPKQNIHRIMGEANPRIEAKRYSDEILKNIPVKNNLPLFDFIILGLGTDGHTASIFPNQMELLNSNNICEVAAHPATKQKRITLTGNVINNANNISFLVTGKSKAEVIANIFEKKNNYKNYPASYIKPIDGNLIWFLDKDASESLQAINFY